MRVLIADWPVTWYGTDPRTIDVARFDLENRDHLMGLILSAGTGRFDEACVEFDCIEAYETFRGLVIGTGGAIKIACRASDEQRRLFRPGYEIFSAGDKVIYFLNPAPRPDLFLSLDDGTYVQEFQISDDT